VAVDLAHAHDALDCALLDDVEIRTLGLAPATPTHSERSIGPN
jgi:hypothetical protein